MTHKQTIPSPHEVPPHHEEKVLEHVMKQFGFIRDPNTVPHYWAAKGSFIVEPIKPGEARVSFVRLDDPTVPAAPHTLDLK